MKDNYLETIKCIFDVRFIIVSCRKFAKSVEGERKRLIVFELYFLFEKDSFTRRGVRIRG